MAPAETLSHNAGAESKTNTRQSFDRKVLPERQQSIVSVHPSRTNARQIPHNYHRIVFSDPVAFRYLEEDETTIALDRSARLQGYELYVVEQWVCSRTHPTFIICTYTGDFSQSILVNVLAIPNDKQDWSERLKIYFKAISQYHAREQDTPLGVLTVTNLSSFPSALTVISVPDGDVKKHKDKLMVNENLKRMGCAGRAATTLQPPPASTIAKYHHLYATSEVVPLRASVVELVKICQLALVLYGKLNLVYADGLLCDITEQALSDWWRDIGTEFHNIEPSDGVFGPTTVAALLGLLAGAHNRLKSAGVAIGKDALDVVSMKRSIGHFQRTYKVTKTRRLDRETLDRLHRTTAKFASGDGWTVPRAVKTTVAELSGKGGEMVMGMVGAKDKATISEIETLDIEHFAQLVTGARMKWLWQGKPIKSMTGDMFTRQSDDYKNRRVGVDDENTFLWTSTSREPGEDDNVLDATNNHSGNDGKFGRFRDVVGIPGRKLHHARVQNPGGDNTDSEDPSSASKISAGTEFGNLSERGPRRSTSGDMERSHKRNQSPKPALNLALATNGTSHKSAKARSTPLKPAHLITDGRPYAHREQLRVGGATAGDSPTRKKVKHDLYRLHNELKRGIYQNFGSKTSVSISDATILRRTKSVISLHDVDMQIERLNHIPRRLTFSVFELSLRTAFVSMNNENSQNKVSREMPIADQMLEKEARATELQELTEQLMSLENVILPYTREEVESVAKLDTETQEALSDLNNIYYGHLEEYQTLQATSTDLLAREKWSLNDGLRRIEMLGQKLDYELNSLQSRMQEVEDGNADFEKNVLEIEARLASLADESQGDRVAKPWLQRLFDFFI